MPDQQPVIDFLHDPRSYGHAAEPFEVRQTHISWVFLAGPYAYKLKKAVSLGFLDYSTPRLRRHFCEEEVRLNRRLAPGIYLGVVSLRERDGKLQIGEDGNGREVDTVVLMQRLPEEAMLSKLVEKGRAGDEHIDALARRLASFYRHAPRPPPEKGFGTPAALRRDLLENFEQTASVRPEVLPPGRLDAIRSGQLSFLTLREELFERRVAEAWIVEGHGDLRAEHVAFLPECVVVDCIEFNERFRSIDVASDIAFLVMDLEFLKVPRLGERLVERYVASSGDAGLHELLDFYVSYRAYVRGKVDAIKLAQGNAVASEVAMLEKRARRYFELAQAHVVKFHEPLLIATGGLPGSGKSTLARALAERLGAPCLRSDEVRKELAGLPPTARRAGAFEEGIYAPEHSRRTYEALAERARRLLNEGASVVIDATCARRSERDRLLGVAQEAGAKAAFLECRAPRELLAERLERRLAAGRDPSDATPAILEAQMARYEQYLPGEAIELDTTISAPAVCRRAIAALRRRSGAR
jgi:aminoglycoside phosphotransferase family enzyme/predicted kinase